MLCANRSVAGIDYQRAFRPVYRSHEEPDRESYGFVRFACAFRVQTAFERRTIFGRSIASAEIEGKAKNYYKKLLLRACKKRISCGRNVAFCSRFPFKPTSLADPPLSRLMAHRILSDIVAEH
jgi:exoribonuclease R